MSIMKNQTTVRLPSPRRHRRGLTLTEITMASAIMAVITAALMSLFLIILRQERANITMLRMGYEATALHRDLRRVAAQGADITQVGNVVEFTNSVTGVRSRLEVVSEDGNWDTIGDNYIIFIPDLEDPDNARRVIQWISPLYDDAGNTIPIFQRLPGSPAPLAVNFRVGDRSGPRARNERAQDEDARVDDALTGPGLQSYVFRTVFTPRVR